MLLVTKYFIITTMLKVTTFHLTVIFVLCIVSVNGNDIGDACQNNDYNKAGQCLLLKDCKSALEDISNRKYPQICGFQGSVPIVCCPGVSTPPKSKRKPGDIADQKCWEYSEHVYKFIYPPVVTLNREKLNVSTCTVVKTTLVLGGVDAKDKEFPHMALLGYGSPSNKLWKCGGSLVSDQFVLTAGHCVRSINFGDVKFIRLGELNVARTDDVADPQDFDIIEVIRHPMYAPPSRYNDIALLKMDRAVKFNEFIRPACLHLTTDIPKKRYIATGWGLTEREGKKGSDHLQKVILDSYSQAECNSSYKSLISARSLKYGIVPESQLCAGGKDEEKDTCQGDSGGPIQIYHAQAHCMYSIVGVTSFGKSCGIVGVPGVYTRVSNYIEWIEKTVWP